jgi:GNAT superfamily N-acetyltransferase
MQDISFRVVDKFPEPAYSVLAHQAFADYEESELLSAVAREELAAQATTQEVADLGALRIAAFRGDALVGWTYACPDGPSLLRMVNSGVAPAERRRGTYSELARRVIEHASARGYVSILSRHAANNNPVIIAKLKLGFLVSGFEYSEVYGPLVRLTLLLGALRRVLYQTRAAPIRRARSGNNA